MSFNQTLISGEDGMKIFIFEKTVGNDSITFISVISNDGKIVSEYDNSDIEGLSYFEGEIFYIEGGYIAVVEDKYSEVYSNTYKINYINISTNEIIQKKDINGFRYRILELKNDYVVFSSYDKGSIIVYNINTGDMISEFEQPEGVEFKITQNGNEEIYDCPVSLYDNYIYTFNEKGIYRGKLGNSELECILSSEDTNFLPKTTVYKDIFAVSEDELYVQVINEIASNYEGDYNAKAKFIKYDLTKMN